MSIKDTIETCESIMRRCARLRTERQFDAALATCASIVRECEAREMRRRMRPITEDELRAARQRQIDHAIACALRGAA